MEDSKVILCDTNILIEVYRGNLNILKTLINIGQDNIAVSDVTRAELIYGARDKNELKLIKSDLDKFATISINEEISKLAVLLIEKYALSHKHTLPYAIIASTALCHKLRLYTLNIKDFRYIERLKLYNC